MCDLRPHKALYNKSKFANEIVAQGARVWEPDFSSFFAPKTERRPAGRGSVQCGSLWPGEVHSAQTQAGAHTARPWERSVLLTYYHRLLPSLCLVPLHGKVDSKPSPRFRPNWPRRRARARATPLGGSLERRRGARPMQAPPARPGCAPAPLELGPHGHTPRAGHPGWASSAAARARAIARPRPPPRPTDAGAAAEAPAPRVAAACLASCTRPRRCPARP